MLNFSRPKSIDQAGRRRKRKLQDAVAVAFNFSQIGLCLPESGLFMSSCSCFFSRRDAVVSIDIALAIFFQQLSTTNLIQSEFLRGRCPEKKQKIGRVGLDINLTHMRHTKLSFTISSQFLGSRIETMKVEKIFIESKCVWDRGSRADSYS